MLCCGRRGRGCDLEEDVNVFAAPLRHLPVVIDELLSEGYLFGAVGLGHLVEEE